MGNNRFQKEYWSDRYQNNNTPWDVGQPSHPIAEYIDQVNNKSIKVLIPGSGNSYEAAYMYNQGFQNVYIIDIAQEPLTRFQSKHPYFPKSQILNGDFFEMTGRFDLIIEQTFFCALHPGDRLRYASQVNRLLSSSGQLVGVLFDDPLFEDHPPFGGSKSIYEPIFSKYLDVQIMERCYNSILPRAGRELFIKMAKK